MVVTGDVTQIDLPAQKTSGLIEAETVVTGLPGIAVVHFDKMDVVRHPIVQRIISAYDQLAAKKAKANGTDAGEERGG
jgi:phosphate starvation-inducible PhoH-like protein